MIGAWAWFVAFAGDPVSPVSTEAPEGPESAVSTEQGIAAFADVARVLQHPRCQNCHPSGDAPLQGDASIPHAMEVTRDGPAMGQLCATCHRPVGMQVPGVPPAHPSWHLAPPEQVFVGLSPAALCIRLLDPANTGGKDPSALLEHVTNDSLVRSGWNSPGRTPPPLTHAEFVDRFATWVAAGSPCPLE